MPAAICDGALLAIAATNDDEVNANVVDDARAAASPRMRRGSSGRGDFTMPATVRSGELTFTVDTGGGAPAFCQASRARNRAAFGPDYAGAPKTLARMRTYVPPSSTGDRADPCCAQLAELPVDELAANESDPSRRRASRRR